MHAVIPVKALSDAKQRLSPLLDQHHRAAFSLAMTRDVVAAVCGSGLFDAISLCGSDSRHQQLAREVGVDWCSENSLGARGLNDSLEKFARRIGDTIGGERLAILHSDLPLLTTLDLTTLLAAADDSDIVLVPDRHGRGSNVMVRPSHSEFRVCFGEGSRLRHRELALQSAHSLQECVLDRASWDIDRPEDLQAALQRHGLPAFGKHCQTFFSESDLAARLSAADPQNRIFA